MSNTRVGATLLEALVALMIGTVVMTLAGRTLLHVTSVSRDGVVRDDRLVARRVARLTLRSELAALGPGDARSAGGDSLWLRAVRGAGRVCRSEPDAVVIDLSASRRPDPTKDSLEMVGRLGGVTVVDLTGATWAPGDCGTSPVGRPIRLDAEGPIDPDAVFVRVFETGAYHLALGALRYRRGRGGRQPLTPDVWDRTSTLALDGPWLRVSLRESPNDSMAASLLVRRW